MTQKIRYYGVHREAEAEEIVPPVKSEYRKIRDETAKTLFETTAERFIQAVTEEYNK